MKLRFAGIFSLLVGMTLLMINCSSKSTSPSSPAAPTATFTFTITNTVCTDGSGHTCTPSFTPTPSNTPTLTSTNSPSNTPTHTSSPTVTNSPTDSATSTSTGTPTQSATNTPTATITQTPTLTSTATVTDTLTDSPTPTLTGTPTETATASATPTVTSTPTNSLSPTPTGTPTNSLTATASGTPTSSPTQTATATVTPTQNCTGTYSISGNLDYTGPTVAGNTIYILAVSQGNLGGCNGNSCNPAEEALSTTPGNYSFALGSLPAGSYYLLGFYGTAGSNGPNLGSYDGDYGNVCPITSSTQVVLSSGNTSVSGVGVTFGALHQLWGVNAAVNYSGPQTGGNLQVGIFTGVNASTGAYTTVAANNINSGQTKSIIDQTAACDSSGPAVSVIGWYGDNCAGPNAGDNYTVLSTTEVNNITSTVTVNVSGTATWP
jgi:hypothetical protein